MTEFLTIRASLAAAGFAMAASCAQVPPPSSPTAKALHEAGLTAPLTIYPVRVLGRANTDVADALGLVLEKSGMGELTVAPTAFEPEAKATWEEAANAFGAQVRAAAAKAPRWSLYAEFLGDPKSGPTEVRFVVVDAAGEVALLDRQTPADKTFRRTAGRDPDPLGCSTLVAERVFELAQWKKLPGGVPDGRFAELWRTKSGAPDKAGFAAMRRRQHELRADLGKATVAVYAPLTSQAADAASAGRIATLIASELGCRAHAVADAPTLAVLPSSNQQKRLWDLAAALQKQVQAQPPQASYALVAEINLRAEGGAQSVNIVLCTQAGEVVIADFQNDQHPMFAGREPKTIEDAEKLIAARLVRLLK